MFCQSHWSDASKRERLEDGLSKEDIFSITFHYVNVQNIMVQVCRLAGIDQRPAAGKMPTRCRQFH